MFPSKTSIGAFMSDDAGSHQSSWAHDKTTRFGRLDLRQSTVAREDDWMSLDNIEWDEIHCKHVTRARCQLTGKSAAGSSSQVKAH